MDSPNTLTEDTLQTMLVRTAVMQVQQDAILAALKTLQEGQDALRKELAVLREAQAVTQTSVAVVQNDVTGIKERISYNATQMDERMAFYATKADVESVRSELYKALEAQTWRLLVWMTAVSSGLVGAVYYIASNVH